MIVLAVGVLVVVVSGECLLGCDSIINYRHGFWVVERSPAVWCHCFIHRSMQADQRLESTPVGTPQARANQSHRSQLPVIGGGSRQNTMFDANVGPTYRTSPMARHSVGGSMDSRAINFEASGGKSKRNGTNNAGYL